MSARSRCFCSHTSLSRVLLHEHSRALTVLPTSEDVSIPSSHFRILLLRRLRLPLPLGPRACSCRGPPDEYGDIRRPPRRLCHVWHPRLPCRPVRAGHRAGLPKEAGARVGRNVALAAMNLSTTADASMSYATAPPVWHGVQLAVDATLASAVSQGMADHTPAQRPS